MTSESRLKYHGINLLIFQKLDYLDVLFNFWPNAWTVSPVVFFAWFLGIYLTKKRKLQRSKSETNIFFDHSNGKFNSVNENLNLAMYFLNIYSVFRSYFDKQLQLHEPNQFPSLTRKIIQTTSGESTNRCWFSSTTESFLGLTVFPFWIESLDSRCLKLPRKLNIRLQKKKVSIKQSQ